ncbi:DUF397 domain-containing protein [Saccharopolyspora sp. NPDC050642]|uniref:DUF397 domain-containing protein n=1 Tax=Saccharopolyspora sp. NPDC050642 TaxID=3157099 RepID=UPI0033C4D192
MSTSGAGWRKSSYSGGAQQCVEVGRVAGGAGVRDTKNRAAGYLTATADQWAVFLDAIKADRFSG